jgi:AraC-like DNA-binding protein
MTVRKREPLDRRAWTMRNAHMTAVAASAKARRARQDRDRLMAQLRHDDPKTWTYDALAGLLGISKGAVAKILRESGGKL